MTVVPLNYSVSESESVGYEIGTVRASDSDTGINAEIIYSFTDNNFGIFAINPDTGRITLAKKLGKCLVYFSGINYESIIVNVCYAILILCLMSEIAYRFDSSLLRLFVFSRF